MISQEWVLNVHFGAAAYMTGVIWLIQRVHYPMLADLDPLRAGRACAFHAAKITPVVGIPMFIEAAAAVWLALVPPPGRAGPALAWTGLAVLVALWLLTFAMAVPLHARLALQSGVVDRPSIARLVAWNWPRTILWTVRLLLAAAMCQQFRTPA
ncbi:MAG: hypothetical protein KF805_01700 [Phycisphaeraceae bacterium]|nr:hypothetical protein [Phycisphaeraceae bacterium]